MLKQPPCSDGRPRRSDMNGCVVPALIHTNSFPVQEKGFHATDEAGQYVDIELQPFRCSHYEDNDAH